MAKVDYEALNNMANSCQTMQNQLMMSIHQIANPLNTLMGDGNLKGAGPEAAKNFASSVILPTLISTLNNVELLATSIKKMADDYASNVDTKSWTSEELQEKIDAIQRKIDEIDRKLDRKKPKNKHHLRELKRQYEHKKKIFEKLKDDFEQFCATASVSISFVNTISGIGAISAGAGHNTITMPKKLDWAMNVLKENAQIVKDELSSYKGGAFIVTYLTKIGEHNEELWEKTFGTTDAEEINNKFDKMAKQCDKNIELFLNERPKNQKELKEINHKIQTNFQSKKSILKRKKQFNKQNTWIKIYGLANFGIEVNDIKNKVEDRMENKHQGFIRSTATVLSSKYIAGKVAGTVASKAVKKVTSTAVKTGVKKVVKKVASKAVGKVAKSVCTAIGTAVFPGAGTVVGAVVGTAVEMGVSAIVENGVSKVMDKAIDKGKKWFSKIF